ncbi:MAG: hypothetical protein JO166_20125 [Deltaproteobacteria bacterium]|nr:hypothetical protein [Deltaproteobacteria bacterium]
MAEIDTIKEQIANLKFWLGIMVVTDISLFGWLISHAGRTSFILVFSWLARRDCEYGWACTPPSSDRNSDRNITTVVIMDAITAILLVAVSLVFLGIVFDVSSDR